MSNIHPLYNRRVSIGGPYGGKTYNGRQLALEYFTKHKMKVLFIDTMDDRPDYADVPLRKWQTLQNFKHGVARVYIPAFDKEQSEALCQLICTHLRDCLIVVEDSRKIVPNKLERSQWERLIIDAKQMRCAVLFMYHSFAYVPPTLYDMLDYLQLFRTKKGPHARKSDIGNYEEVFEAWERVMNSKDKFPIEVIENGA